MQGSLAHARGTLFVGVHAKTARVRAFDLGGRELRSGFSFRDGDTGRSAASGLAVDDDHSILVADTPANRVRRFSVFGREVGGIGGGRHDEARGTPVLPALVQRPVDVAAQGNHDEGWIAIACAGTTRHAVQVFDPDFAYRSSCTSFGEPGRAFQGVTRIAADGELLFVAESVTSTVQVFRRGEFSFAFRRTDRLGAALEPSALAPTGDGRLVLGVRSPASSLWLLDASGGPLRCLAEEGEEEGRVSEPSDAVVVPGVDDRHAHLFVIDRDGLRVQAFNLEGHCLGTIPLDEPGDARRTKPRQKKGGR